jgi:hypothetical protein
MTQPNSDIMKTELANRIIKNLENKNYKVVVLNKVEEIKTFIKNSIPESSTIGFGESINYGIANLLKDLGNKILAYWKPGTTNRTLDTFEELPKPDYYLSNIQAITDDGLIVDMDSTNNSDISYESLPKHIIAFGSLNKLMKNIDVTSTKIKKAISSQIQQIITSYPESIEVTVVLIPN